MCGHVRAYMGTCMCVHLWARELPIVELGYSEYSERDTRAQRNHVLHRENAFNIFHLSSSLSNEYSAGETHTHTHNPRKKELKVGY